MAEAGSGHHHHLSRAGSVHKQICRSVDGEPSRQSLLSLDSDSAIRNTGVEAVATALPDASENL